MLIFSVHNNNNNNDNHGSNKQKNQSMYITRVGNYSKWMSV